MASIEIDGKKLDVQAGKMIIEVADEVGIAIPRFCYHKKLSVAANCRMCLVEVEKAPKVMPACATPVTDGMKVFTKSTKAIAAQKAVMEFLLINHPLDCPICDQGGECELQDVSMGFGEGISHFSEGKRVVADENLGSLIATEMTRCIHCTRCVRFGEEVAGLPELGVTFRGEKERIGTYVEHTLQSEISGNVIDLCPVGALTSKPFRFTARAWELQQYASIAPHDCLGSSIHVHVKNNKVMRVVPKENEAINETWLSDRDRFSYLGLDVDRLEQPVIKKNGQWQPVDWETALTLVVTQLKQVIEQHGASQLGALASSSATIEEHYLLQKLCRGLGSHNIDHRLQQSDFSDQDDAPLFPRATLPYAELESQKAILLIGSHLHHEQPLAAVRVRKAALAGARVMVINPEDYSFNFEVTHKLIDQQLPRLLAEVVVALDNKQLAGIKPSEKAQQIAAALRASDKSVLVLGALAHNHPQAATLRYLTALIAQLSGSHLMPMTSGANSAGAWLAGAVPHRSVAGDALKTPGLNAQKMLSNKLKAYILLGIEPELDCVNPSLALQALQAADFVCVLSPYTNQTMLEYAHLILPIAAFTETAGTTVNVEGRWQSFHGCVKPFGQARPAWKVLRVLGNLFALEGFDYAHSEEVRDELKNLVDQAVFKPSQSYQLDSKVLDEKISSPIVQWPIYGIDSIVRRAVALQRTGISRGK